MNFIVNLDLQDERGEYFVRPVCLSHFLILGNLLQKLYFDFINTLYVGVPRSQEGFLSMVILKSKI